MVGGESDKKAATSRPDHLWPELWTKLGRNAQLKERQKWSHEKPKLDNARKLRGTFFIDPEDMEFKEIIKNNGNSTPHTSHFLAPACAHLMSHRHWLKFGVRSAHFMRRLHALMLCV